MVKSSPIITSFMPLKNSLVILLLLVFASCKNNTNQAVVFISTVSVEIDPFDWLPQAKPSKGSGSGVIISAKDGLIITNLHVIEQASKIEIYLADDLKYQAYPK